MPPHGTTVAAHSHRTLLDGIQRERLGSDELCGECWMLSQPLKIKKPRRW
jgi:hypothetical protein